MYRQQFPQNTLIFLFISDDPQWAREKLLPRVKTKGLKEVVLIQKLYLCFIDLIITGTQIDSSFNIDASSTGLNQRQTAAGLDLALLASCNHTITSYGSYSFWASFLAGKGTCKFLL